MVRSADLPLTITIDSTLQYHSDLDQNPIVAVTPASPLNPNSFCIFEQPTFNVHDFKAINSTDGVSENDPEFLLGVNAMFNLPNSNILIWQSSNTTLFYGTNIRSLIVNWSLSNYTPCEWDLQGYLPGLDDNIVITPWNNDTLGGGVFRITIANLGASNSSQPSGKGVKSNPNAPYLLTVAMNALTGCLVQNALAFYPGINVTAGYHISTIGKIVGLVQNSTLSFGMLDPINHVFNPQYSYGITSELKDFFVCDDMQSVIIIDSKFSDNLYITTISNFGQAGFTRLMNVACDNITLIPASYSRLIVSCTFNSIMSQNTTLYYLTGNSFTTYKMLSFSVNTTQPIKRADLNQKFIYAISSNREMYFYFRDANLTSFFNLSWMVISHPRYMIVSNDTSGDITSTGFMIAYDHDGYPEIAAGISQYSFSSYDIGYMMNCTFPSTMDKSFQLNFNVTTLANNYIVSFTKIDTDPTKAISSIVKNIMITSTIVLAMVLIMGSFLLLSRKSKEEDVVLDEFKLDYIKFTHKKTSNDSSSLIEHDVD